MIKLDQYLKLMGLAQSGGQAKHLIQNGFVQVNGMPEVRRGRKLQPGDTVSLDDETVQVTLEQLQSRELEA